MKKSKPKKSPFKIGQTFDAPFPFYIGYSESLNGWEKDKYVLAWRPGFENDEGTPVANGMGKVRYEIHGIYKPGNYPERIFYTKEWIPPQGDSFRSTRLFIISTQGFKDKILGYTHGFEIAKERLWEGSKIPAEPDGTLRLIKRYYK